MKFKKIVAVSLLFGLVLAGCSSNTERKTTVCSGNEPDDEVSFVSEGDKIITQTEYDSWSWDDLGLTAEDVKDEAIMTQILAAYRDLYDMSKGLDITYAIDEEAKTVKFTLVIDYTVADMKELEALGVVDDSESDYLSLEATIESFENNDGMTCK